MRTKDSNKQMNRNEIYELAKQQGMTPEQLAMQLEYDKQRQKEIQREKRKKRFRNILIILVLLALVWFIGGKILQLWQEKKIADSTKELPLDLMGLEVPTEEEYENMLKEQPSDLTGKTKYEKCEMGLLIEDGSDSDYDGLTDKEELEIYGSDPLLASTAGDLYTDGYKLEHSMDLFTFYEYEGEQAFPQNECGEIILTADIPSDFQAVIKDCTDNYSLKEFGIDRICKGYWLYNYQGTVSIDAAAALEGKETAFSDCCIFICEGAFIEPGLIEFKKCKYSDEDGIITLDYEFDHSKQYYIYIAEKKNLISSIADMVPINKAEADPDKTEGMAMMYGSLGLYMLTGKGIHLIYSEMPTEKENELLIKKAIEYYAGASDKTVIGSYDELTSAGTDKLISKSLDNVNKKYQMYKKFFPWAELADTHVGDSWIRYSLFSYKVFSCDVSELDREENGTSEFDKMVDELPFGNFGSSINAAGNCAGISHLTSYLYNTQSLPSTGSYQCNVNGTPTDIRWDLTTDEDNGTLMDLGLSDYKDADFVKNHSTDGGMTIDSELSDGETQFVNMIGCFWAEANDRFDASSHIRTNGEKNSYKMIKKVKKYIDKGKVVDAYLYFMGMNGHAVNLYDYKVISKDEIWFYVYDNNIPQDHAALVDDACYLKVKKIRREDGTAAFEYLYWPLGENSPRYLATSYSELMPTSMIAIMDENWNVF